MRVAGIKRSAIGIARPAALRVAFGNHPGDLAAAFKARVEETQAVQARERRAIVVEMRALAADRLFPGQPQPFEILIDGLLELRPAERAINVLYAQQELPARGSRHVKIDQRGERMAEMEITIRARRKPKDRRRHVADQPSSDNLWPSMASHVLRNQADLDAGLAILTANDPRLAKLVPTAGRPALRQGPAGLAGLCAIICAQQLSTASASAIWGRFSAAFDPFHHDALRRARSDKLARIGLSRPKIKTVKAIGAAIAKGDIDLEALAGMEADDAHSALTALHGIGPWTADIYLLFCLGHADAWPAGDLALQEAARLLLKLRARLSSRDMGPLAEAWRPWRGAAACMLWTYYRAAKQRDGAAIAPTKSARSA